MESASPDTNRNLLERRQLQDAHLKMCMLDVFKALLQVGKFALIFKKHCTPLYYEAFLKQYAG